MPTNLSYTCLAFTVMLQNVKLEFYKVNLYLVKAISLALILFSLTESWFSLSMVRHDFKSIETFGKDFRDLIESKEYKYDLFNNYKASTYIIGTFISGLNEFKEKHKKYIPAIDKALTQYMNVILDSGQKRNISAMVGAVNLCGTFYSIIAKNKVSEDFKDNFNKLNEYIANNFPQRLDLVTGYLNYCLDYHHTDKIKDITSRALKSNPNNPIALWFEGMNNILQKNNQAGFSLLKKAIHNGVDKYMPLPKDFVNQIAAFG